MKITHRAGPIETAALFAMGVLLLLLYVPPAAFYMPIASLFRLDLFLNPARVLGGSYEGPGVGLLWLHILCAIFFISIAVVVFIVRRLSDRSRASSLIVFRIITGVLFLPPTCMLVYLFLRLTWYTGKMGFTPMRALGFAADFTAFAIVALFLVWACGFRTGRNICLTTASSEPSSAGAAAGRSR